MQFTPSRRGASRAVALLATGSAQPALIDAYKRDAASAITADAATGQVTFGGSAGGGKMSRHARKAMMRGVQKELTAAGRAQLDVSKLHPRWLRAVVGDMLDAGAQITRTEVEVLRAHGPEGARAVVEAYTGYAK